jgi:hypothetical protein
MNSASQRGPFAEETLGAGRARVSRQTIAEAPEIRVGLWGRALPPTSKRRDVCRPAEEGFRSEWASLTTGS